jgi:tetratricopeptide (TPR) repeat protein
MSRLLLFILLIVCMPSVQAAKATNYKLSELRVEYLAASKDEDAAKEFYAKMEKYTGQEPVVLSYKAASEAVMAKYVWNPYFKMKHLNAAMDLFEEAVSLNRENPEIRFLRFIVEYHIPGYLNMSQHMAEDKAIVIEGLVEHPKSGINTALAQTMRNVLLEKERCTPEEKELLKSLKI